MTDKADRIQLEACVREAVNSVSGVFSSHAQAEAVLRAAARFYELEGKASISELADCVAPRIDRLKRL